MNSSGQLGNGTTANTDNNDRPTQVINITDVVAVAAGENHTLALKNDGTLWAWGVNRYGQFGDGSALYSTTPVKVIIKTPTLLPAAITGEAQSVLSNSSILNGTVNPNGAATTYYFQYGTTTNYSIDTISQSAGSGSTDSAVKADITGLTPNTTYHFRLVATNSVGTTNGNDLTFTTLSTTPTPVATQPIPDTGITKCYNDSEEIPCPSEGQDFYGQDGNYSINPMSYTKLDANGNDLPITATDWAMIRDNVTGLIWENNSHQSTWDNASTVIASLNTAKFGGYSDWRLPTMTELGSIVDFSVSYPGPTINTSYFQDTTGDLYWSSSPDACNIGYAWGVGFGFGTDHNYFDKNYSGYVRAVRGGQSVIGSFDPLVINGDRIVFDNTTGLMWQQDTAKTATGSTTMVWKEALSYCENLTLGGYTDWRLPTIKELRSIVDYRVYSPAIDIGVFKDTISDFYLSSSPNAYGVGYVWGVYFDFGGDGGGYKNYGYYVRAVRNIHSTPTEDFGSLKVSISPEEAVTAGAAWRIDSGDWHDSDDTVFNIAVGTHTVNFKDITGWTTPSNQTVTIENEKTATVTATYTAVENISVLTPSSPNATVTAGEPAKLFGSSTASSITIEAGATAKLINFPGSNTITIKGDSTNFKVSRSGSTVTFEGTDGTYLKMPATKTAQTIIFNDVSAKLVIENNKLMFGTQAVTLTAEGITGGSANQPTTFTNSLNMTFNLIPAGTFTMGSPSDELGRSSNEAQHQVTLTNDYYMQTTEVTQGQWKAVMGSNPSYFSSCGDNCPVEQVSWDDIQTFVTKLNAKGEGTYSLPTEAQWEYAARAGSITAFANGGITKTDCSYDSNLDAIGWYCYNAGGKTHSVAQKSPNNWGLYDMHGNVWEWCQDWYGDYSSVAATDTVGPAAGSNRVFRGGGWAYLASYCRSANRGLYAPSFRSYHFGFRLVCPQGHQ